ncbi:MAG: GAF domain-containing protein [Alicyclobacillus sp.]|nr:GAF domain-containing protein [Alicyclobacillus sp.]
MRTIIGDTITNTKYAIYIYILLTVVLVLIFYILWKRFKNNDEIHIQIWGFSIKLTPNSEIHRLQGVLKELQSEYDKLNQDSKHKSDILTLIDQVGLHARRLFEAIIFEVNNEEFATSLNRALNFVSHAIHHGICNGQCGRSRVAIFTKEDDEDFLRLFHGLGYSSEAQENLRLPIHSSFAGRAYLTKETQKTGDFLSISNQYTKLKGQHTYSSLMCTPIIFHNEVLGVLCIDAEESDAFSDFHADIFRCFANQLSLLLVAHRIRCYMYRSSSSVASSNFVEGAVSNDQ